MKLKLELEDLNEVSLEFGEDGGGGGSIEGKRPYSNFSRQVVLLPTLTAGTYISYLPSYHCQPVMADYIACNVPEQSLRPVFSMPFCCNIDSRAFHRHITVGSCT